MKDAGHDDLGCDLQITFTRRVSVDGVDFRGGGVGRAGGLGHYCNVL